MAADNMTLGRFELVGIPPAPRGVPQIEVSFAIDTDGVVNVSAKDLGTGKVQSIELIASSGLSEAEVDRLVSEAVGHGAADQMLRARVDLQNRADGLIYSAAKALEEFSEDVDENDVVSLTAQIEKTRELLGGDEFDALKLAVDELTNLSYVLTEKLYATLSTEEAGTDAKTEPAED